MKELDEGKSFYQRIPWQSRVGLSQRVSTCPTKSFWLGGHSRFMKRVASKRLRSHIRTEGLNVGLFQMLQWGIYQPCIRRNVERRKEN